MSTFIEYLEGLNKGDTKVRAVLRRSLSFEPGVYPAAFPYVEPYLKDEDGAWRRKTYYLVAGLWAQHWRERLNGEQKPIGMALADYVKASGSQSVEQRFIALLDADEDQLSYRLRQIIALLKEQKIDFEKLLKNLLTWNNENKWTQRNWAQDFYRSLNKETTHEETQP
ncbi:MAG: type I-E CRISPR-associated protein Cse2/CasB [Lentisphaeria bacterium]